MENIPFDITINHILPYTYHIQSNALLEDIRNYSITKEILMNKRYDTCMIKHEILAVFYDNKSTLSTILQRLFPMKSKEKNYHSIYRFSKEQRFNILFGLFTKEERLLFVEHILEDDGIWFLSQ